MSEVTMKEVEKTSFKIDFPAGKHTTPNVKIHGTVPGFLIKLSYVLKNGLENEVLEPADIAAFCECVVTDLKEYVENQNEEDEEDYEEEDYEDEEDDENEMPNNITRIELNGKDAEDMMNLLNKICNPKRKRGEK